MEDGVRTYLCVEYHSYRASLLPDYVRFELGAMVIACHTYMTGYTRFNDQEDKNPRIIRGCSVGQHGFCRKMTATLEGCLRVMN